MAVAQSLEEVASLSEGLVCEYLKRRGLTKTLETFNMEISEEKVRCVYVGWEKRGSDLFHHHFFFPPFLFLRCLLHGNHTHACVVQRDEDDLSSQLWLELRQRLRVNEFIRNNAALVVKGQPPTTLEILLHLSNNSFKDEAQRALVPDFVYRSTIHQKIITYIDDRLCLICRSWVCA